MNGEGLHLFPFQTEELNKLFITRVFEILILFLLVLEPFLVFCRILGPGRLQKQKSHVPEKHLLSHVDPPFVFDITKELRELGDIGPRHG